jgi:hypothetical protein
VTVFSRNLLSGVLLLLAIGLCAVVSVLMAAHDRPIAVFLAPVTIDPSDQAWHMRHVLVDGCPCSEAVARHLLKRGPKPGVREHIYLIANDPQAQFSLMLSLRQIGFETSVMNAWQARTALGVAGAPMLLVSNGKGQRLYAGGYGPGRPSSRSGPAFYQDENILLCLKSGGRVKGYPVMGCSTAQTPAQVWTEFTSVWRSEGGE